MLNGIDVSSWQGNFGWPAWHGKIQFAGIKVSDGTGFADPDAAANIAGARAIGAVPMGYHFLHAGLSGSAQAEWFLRWAHAAGLRPGDLIAVDCEDQGLDGEGYAQMDLTASAFCGEIGRHFPGFNAVVYTEISMAPHLVHCGESPLWLANPSGTHTGQLGPWKTPSFEQTGQRGTDVDVFYGTAEQLAKLAIPHAG